MTTTLGDTESRDLKRQRHLKGRRQLQFRSVQCQTERETKKRDNYGLEIEIGPDPSEDIVSSFKEERRLPCLRY